MSQQRWMVLGAVFIARTSMGYQFQSIGSVGPLLVTQLAIDFAVLGSLIGIYKLPGVVLAYPSGLAGNRFGEKAPLIFSMAVMAAGGLISASSEIFAVVFAGRLLSGAGAVLFNVLSAKMVADWFAEKELTLALAIHVNSWPFGIALGLATQATLTEVYSVQGMLIATTIFCVVGMVILWVGSADFTSPGDGSTYTPRRGLTWREFVLISLASMVWLLLNANLILVVSFSPAYLTSLGFDVAAAGRVSSVGTWLGVLAIPLGGLIAQRWMDADRFMVLTLLAGAAATIAIVGLGRPLWSFAAFGLIAWMPAGAVFALPMGVLRPENRAVGMGVFLSYYYIGIGLFPPLAGHLRDLTGHPATPLLFAAGLLVAATVMLVVFRMSQRRMSPPRS